MRTMKRKHPQERGKVRGKRVRAAVVQVHHTQLQKFWSKKWWAIPMLMKNSRRMILTVRVRHLICLMKSRPVKVLMRRQLERLISQLHARRAMERTRGTRSRGQRRRTPQDRRLTRMSWLTGAICCRESTWTLTDGIVWVDPNMLSHVVSHHWLLASTTCSVLLEKHLRIEDLS